MDILNIMFLSNTFTRFTWNMDTNRRLYDIIIIKGEN